MTYMVSVSPENPNLIKHEEQNNTKYSSKCPHEFRIHLKPFVMPEYSYVQYD